MNGEALWNKVISELSFTGEELQTTTGLWFKAFAKGERLYVNSAMNILHPAIFLSKGPYQRRISY